MLRDFKEFAMRGNVIDLAVGVVIGTAFGKIISSLVDNMIMPVVGLLTGGIDFSKLVLPLAHDADGHVTTAIGYGAFINATVQFMIVAFALFLLVKLANKAAPKKPAAETKPAPTPSEALLKEIRDLLKKQK